MKLMLPAPGRSTTRTVREERPHFREILEAQPLSGTPVPTEDRPSVEEDNDRRDHVNSELVPERALGVGNVADREPCCSGCFGEVVKLGSEGHAERTPVGQKGDDPRAVLGQSPSAKF